MMLPERCSILLLCLTNALQLTQCQPVSGAAAGNDDFVSHKDEIVLVEDVVRYTDIGTNSTATLITLSDPMMLSADANVKQVAALEKVEQLVHHQDNVDNESTLDTSAGASDDLIFLAVKKPTHLQEQQQPQKAQQQQHHQHRHHHNHHQHRGIHEIDLLTVDDLFASSSSCSSASCESPDATDDAEDDTVPREIERLQTDDALSSSSSSSPAGPTRPSIDMRDFVALIPADEVKSIVANYYRNDAEVQRAYAYLSGRDFLVLKQRIIAIPEMSAFLRYLNASGLDVVGFFYTLTNLTSKPAENAVTQLPAASLESHSLNSSSSTSGGGNDILKNSILSPTTTNTTTATTSMLINSLQPTTIATTSDAMPTTATASTTTTTAAAESLNGLHGLVDSILDILPQDQILTTFFDKLESNEQFSKLVDNVGSPEFAKILHNMENSVPLRNLIFTLHNNGIYITRIVDSLKAYFFLGTF